MRITQLRLSNGVTVKPARDLTLSVPVGATLRRTTAERTSEPFLLADFVAGAT